MNRVFVGEMRIATRILRIHSGLEGLDAIGADDCARGTFEAWEIEPNVASFESAAQRIGVLA